MPTFVYPPSWSINLLQSIRLLSLSVVGCYVSVCLAAYLQYKYQIGIPLTYFVVDANKLGSVLVAVFLFTTFRNLNIGYSKFINLVAKTTFGVLMIHANSDAWRTFMWRDLLHVDSSASLSAFPLIGRSIVIVGGVFICCSLLDIIRIYLIERPTFEHFDRIEDWIRKIQRVITRFLKSIYQALLRWTE